jgi:hypothetical protein
MPDWVQWHAEYDNPSSRLASRLRQVQLRLSQALDRAPGGTVRLLSLCAGQGHDVLGVLPGHPRQDDVRAVLVEFSPDNVAAARRRAAGAGLGNVEVRQADASQVTAFADAVPADVLLLCGIFGNISDDDVRATVEAAPALCAPGATVIWTRGRFEPDLTPQIRAWFTGTGFEELAFDSGEPTGDDHGPFGVGADQLRSTPPAELPASPLFTFTR